MNANILVIYTGGTIGMKEDPLDLTLKPFDFSQILEEVPELRKFKVQLDTYTFDPLIDSSDVEPGMWIRLAELIREKYPFYDGFVVLHGEPASHRHAPHRRKGEFRFGRGNRRGEKSLRRADGAGSGRLLRFEAP